METRLCCMPEDWEGDGGVIVFNNPAYRAFGKVTEWQKQTCPDCGGGGAMCCGQGKYGDSNNAQHIPVFRKCPTCQGMGHVMLADYYEKGEHPDTQNPSLQGTGHLVDRTLQGVVRLGNQKEE